ncbi:MAG: hypothetical protein Q9162_003167 [Coniocarpon cinnabarinum]
MSFLNTRWGRDEVAGRHRPSLERTSRPETRQALRNSKIQSKPPFQGSFPIVSPLDGHGKKIYLFNVIASASTPAYLAELRSPTKRTVSRTPQPRCFSPRQEDKKDTAPVRTLKRKAAFEPRPTALNERSINETSGGSRRPLGTYSKAAPRQSTAREGFDQPRPTPSKPKVEVKTTYAVKPPPNYSLPLGARKPTPIPPAASSPSSHSPKTRMYRTSSTRTTSPLRTSPRTSRQSNRSTPNTSPPTSTHRPVASPLNAHPTSTASGNTGTRRRQAVYATTPSPSPTASPPRAYRRVENPTRFYSDSSKRSSNGTRFPISSSSASQPTPTSTSPAAKDPRRSYRYPSLSQGTAATPHRRINAGMLPIDTSLSSNKAASQRPTFLRESPTKHSKYPKKQREGVMLEGERERAFRGWLGRGKEKKQEKTKVGGFGVPGDVGLGGSSGEYRRRMKRRGKGMMFWEWSPR